MELNSNLQAMEPPENWVRYWPLLIKPTILGVLGCVLWYILGIFHIRIHPNDSSMFEPMLDLIAIAHGMIATSQLNKMDTKHDNIKEAMRTHDIPTFEKNLYIHINGVYKFLLFIFSVIYFFVFVVFPFSTVSAGRLTVWVIIFIFYIIWEVALELENTFRGVCSISREKLVKAFGEEYVTELYNRIPEIRKRILHFF